MFQLWAGNKAATFDFLLKISLKKSTEK